jgi:hypothetical protein
MSKLDQKYQNYQVVERPYWFQDLQLMGFSQ